MRRTRSGKTAVLLRMASVFEMEEDPVAAFDPAMGQGFEAEILPDGDEEVVRESHRAIANRVWRGHSGRRL